MRQEVTDKKPSCSLTRSLPALTHSGLGLDQTEPRWCEEPGLTAELQSSSGDDKASVTWLDLMLLVATTSQESFKTLRSTMFNMQNMQP